MVTLYPMLVGPQLNALLWQLGSWAHLTWPDPGWLLFCASQLPVTLPLPLAKIPPETQQRAALAQLGHSSVRNPKLLEQSAFKTISAPIWINAIGLNLSFIASTEQADCSGLIPNRWQGSPFQFPKVPLSSTAPSSTSFPSGVKRNIFWRHYWSCCCTLEVWVQQSALVAWLGTCFVLYKSSLL